MYVATGSLIGGNSVRRFPNIRLQQISCFGGSGSSNSRQGVPANSLAGNVSGALQTIDKNKEFIKMSHAVFMVPE